MFRFNFILIALLLLSLSSWGQNRSRTVRQKAPARGIYKASTFAVGYQSWLEFMDLTNGPQVDTAYASFFGLTVGIDKESYRRRWGSILEGSLLFGQANGGGSQSLVSYQTSYRTWYGAQGSYRLAYRVNPQVTLSIGPMALVRQVSWPTEGTSIEVKSGAPLNLGAIADIRVRVNRKWELRQMVGTMAFKASTVWSLGLGYKF